MFVLNSDLSKSIRLLMMSRSDVLIMLRWFHEDMHACCMENKQGATVTRTPDALWNAAAESNNCNFLFIKRHLVNTSIFYSFLMIQGSEGHK